MGGQVGQCHGVHLLGDHLVAFVVRGGKVDVQVTKLDYDRKKKDTVFCWQEISSFFVVAGNFHYDRKKKIHYDQKK